MNRPVTPEDRWADDALQFTRLLAEIMSMGLSPEQYRHLEAETDLTQEQLDELLDRADVKWQAIKAAL